MTKVSSSWIEPGCNAPKTTSGRPDGVSDNFAVFSDNLLQLEAIVAQIRELRRACERSAAEDGKSDLHAQELGPAAGNQTDLPDPTCPPEPPDSGQLSVVAVLPATDAETSEVLSYEIVDGDCNPTSHRYFKLAGNVLLLRPGAVVPEADGGCASIDVLVRRSDGTSKIEIYVVRPNTGNSTVDA